MTGASLIDEISPRAGASSPRTNPEAAELLRGRTLARASIETLPRRALRLRAIGAAGAQNLERPLLLVPRPTCRGPTAARRSSSCLRATDSTSASS